MVRIRYQAFCRSSRCYAGYILTEDLVPPGNIAPSTYDNNDDSRRFLLFHVSQRHRSPFLYEAPIRSTSRCSPVVVGRIFFRSQLSNFCCRLFSRTCPHVRSHWALSYYLKCCQNRKLDVVFSTCQSCVYINVVM